MGRERAAPRPELTTNRSPAPERALQNAPVALTRDEHVYASGAPPVHRRHRGTNQALTRVLCSTAVGDAEVCARQSSESDSAPHLAGSASRGAAVRHG